MSALRGKERPGFYVIKSTILSRQKIRALTLQKIKVTENTL